jgi:uncharacterized protein YjeT (DUF2065 family)
MAQDFLTAIALLLILEGLLPGLAPSAWLKVMRDAAKLGTRGIRIAGIISMLSGAVMLQLIN